VCKRFLVGVQEVPSSNLGGPTKFLIDLQTGHSPPAAFWSPTGVQNGRQPGRPPQDTKNAAQIPGASLLLYKTRQTRHFDPKLLILLAKLMSGF